MISTASSVSINKPSNSEQALESKAKEQLNSDGSEIFDFLNLLQNTSLEKNDSTAEAVSNLPNGLSEKIKALLVNKNFSEKNSEYSIKDAENIIELLVKDKNLQKTAKDKFLNIIQTRQVQNGKDLLSPLDFQASKLHQQVNSNEALKKYLKSSDSNIIKLDGVNANDKIEQMNLNQSINNRLLNDLNLGNTNGSEISNGKKADKNSIDSLASQITQRINDINMIKPMQINSETTIDFNHSELGSMTLSIKKLQKDLNIKITTGQADTKNLLIENRDALLSQLSQRGISVANLAVDSVISTAGSDEAKGFPSQKFDSSSQQQSSDQQQQAKNTNQNQSEREKRNELWSILKDQREVMYA